jgi:1,4-dihydroxy-2-naphthoate octaprenyltransferase
VIPVLVGSAIAHAGGSHTSSIGLVCLLTALLLQIGSNLANDALDFRHGVDDERRLGPPRATQQGWLSYEQVLGAALASLGLALVLGLWLVRHGGWPILAVGLIAIASALAYSGGPYPLARHGLGEVAAFVFFGLVAVSGTTWLHTGRLDVETLLAAVPIGMLVTCIMLVNNLRDIDSDQQTGKRTLAVRLGAEKTRGLLALLVGVSMLWPALTATIGPGGAGALLAWGAVPLVPPLLKRLGHARGGPEFNQCLAETARLHAVFGLLYALGIWL